MALWDLLFGRPLRTREEAVEELGPLSAIPVLGLDTLSSAAYAPEAALTVLLPLGTVASDYIGPLTVVIIVVLVAVFLSYWQTIGAYPNGGGSFTVAKENLGRLPGLLAASSLLIDYVLNAAVAISAGVGALVSALPGLVAYTLPLCLVLLLFLTLVNLRGIRSAGLVFILPAYLFVGCLSIIIIAGVVKTILGQGHPIPLVRPPRHTASMPVIGIWLLLRAFASGCTALTGVEAVSNAVPIFRQPRVVQARRTLTIIISLLVFLLAGVAFLAHAYGITATSPGQSGYQSVLSQLVAAVAGRGVFYFLNMAAILLVLALSANTSFTGFPRVCRVLALDEFLPAGFAHRGRRLVYTEGVVVLAILAGALLIAFGGITNRLIPMFAVGAFGAFTLSQLGMVIHWRRAHQPRTTRSLIINGFGALMTATALLIIISSKFTTGAWLTVLVVPSLVLLLLRLQQHQDQLERETDVSGRLDASGLSPPIIIIPVKQLNRVTRKALRLALTLSPEIHAVQVLAEELRIDDLSQCWSQGVEQPAREAGYSPPKLVVLPSQFREFNGPLLSYIRRLAAQHPERTIAVLVPELVQRRWWHFLFLHRATVLKGLLLLHGGPQIVVINAPWYLR
jgi:amino acid transporter